MIKANIFTFMQMTNEQVIVKSETISWPEGFEVIDFFESVKGMDAALLQSALQIGDHGNLSILGFNPLDRFIARDIADQADAQKALAGLSAFYDQYRDLGLVDGFLLGYFSYDFGVKLAGIMQTVKSDYSLPQIYYVLPSQIVVCHHDTRMLQLMVVGQESDCATKLIEFKKYVQNFCLKHVQKNGQNMFKSDSLPSNVRSNVTYEEYQNVITKVKEYLVNGETYQVNFSQRFSADFSGLPFDAYKKMTAINPSPFHCYFDFEGVTIASNSPERLICGKFVQNTENFSTSYAHMHLSSRPIKGTVPRGSTDAEEKKYSKQLLESEKDAAELIMIVDLVRNDIGQVAEVGTVQVTEPRVIEKYSHVQHTMATVVGILEQGKTWKDVIEALFPGGSITGCPKYRTMHIIDTLEEFQRGVYCGSAGYIRFTGEFDFNIMIRTLAFVDGKVYFNSGGGIVIDSTPESEYHETLDKARALMQSIS